MDKSFLDLIKRQQESMEWVKSITRVPTISESLQKALSANTVGGLLASEQGKLASSIISSSALDRLKISDFANITGATTSIFRDGERYKSLFATDTIALQAAAQVRVLADSTRHYDLAFKGLGSITGSGGIADSIARMNPVLPSSFISQHTALEQFKVLTNALRSGDVFGDAISKTLRPSLGDWREQIVLPALPQTLYEARGFNRSLTQLPTEMFFGVVAEAGLTDAELDIELFGPVIRGVGDENLSGEERNRKCYSRLFMLETRVRKFIFEAMTNAYGSAWFKRLPPDVKDSMMEMKERKAKAGDERTLMDCSDFSHYVKIIFKKDLWREVFQPLFGARRMEDALESFNRLKPVRDTTMHNLPVTHEDWVMLHFETGRLLTIISRAAISG